MAEAGGALLLFAGLFTRLGALALFGVTLMIQLVVPFTGDGVSFNPVELALWAAACWCSWPGAAGPSRRMASLENSCTGLETAAIFSALIAKSDGEGPAWAGA